MKRYSEEQPIKKVLEELVKTYQLGGKITEAKIINVWGELVGEHIAKHTQNVYLSKGKLVIKVDSAPLKQELFMYRDAIMMKVNQKFGEGTVNQVIVS